MTDIETTRKETVKALRREGYSERAIQEILKWYE